MQFKTIASLLALASVAIAIPTEPAPIPASQCNTGPIQCCNSLQAANVPAVSTLLGLLGIVVQPITALVGLTCSPISVIALPGNSWSVSSSSEVTRVQYTHYVNSSAQPVCCTNNSFNGIVALGCTPVNINL
ncbi:hypothetical protein D9611_000563 [Ephemerocybe angulata]|uniref:Hydrophobin n=1 Tax=Ephemerocybe angulata TaxID=980116 RepID=A0A8H5BMK8_9AGAR|nr:hypothetical protein D9611_000563 [Tulosesus angulatus]